MESSIEEQPFSRGQARVLRDSSPVMEKVVMFGDVTEDYSFRVYLMPRHLDPGDAASKLRRPWAQHPEFLDVEYFPHVLASFNGKKEVLYPDLSGDFSINVVMRPGDRVGGGVMSTSGCATYKFRVSKNLYQHVNTLTIEDEFIEQFEAFDKGGYEIYRELVHVFQKYVDTPRWVAAQTALWVMGTYLFNGFNAFPYLLLMAERGSGKTRFLELIRDLSSIGFLWVKPTLSTLFRAVHALHPTVCLDEMEWMNDERNPDGQEMLNILNAGYQKGAIVPRTASEKGMIVEYFNVYCPKAIATTQEISGVLNSRCLRLPILRTTNPDFVASDPSSDKEYLEDIQRDLVFWSIVNGAGVAAIDKKAVVTKYRGDPRFSGAPPRVFQIMVPILTMFEYLNLGELTTAEKDHPLWADELGDLAKCIEYQAAEAKAQSVDDDVQLVLITLLRRLQDVGVPVKIKDILEDMPLELDEKKFFTPKRIGKILAKFDVPKRKVDGRPEYFGGYKWNQSSALEFLNTILTRYSVDTLEAVAKRDAEDRKKAGQSKIGE